jgi:hypothetical protein
MVRLQEKSSCQQGEPPFDRQPLGFYYALFPRQPKRQLREGEKTDDGQVAQLVEQWTENPCVGGSIPPLTT